MARKSLTIGLVTRGRPDLLRQTVDATVANIRGDTQLIVLADSDDESMWGWKHDVAKINLSQESDVFMGMVDHSPIRTAGFDTKIHEALTAFPDGIGAACDHMSCLAFPHYNIATAGWVKAVGYFYPTHFPYWFVDHWFDDVQRMTGRYVHVDIHVDSSARPGTQDQREPGLWASLYDALYQEREAAAERLLAVMDEPEWRKDMLRRNYVLTHERSRIINNMVRSVEGACQTQDDRYKRIRRAGEQKLLRIYRELEAA